MGMRVAMERLQWSIMTCIDILGPLVVADGSPLSEIRRETFIPSVEHRVFIIERASASTIEAL